MSPPSRRHPRRVIIAAVVTSLIAAVMAVSGSGLMPADERSRYATAIVALELARTPADVFAALGPTTSDAREVLRRVTAIDFLFLVAYPLLSLAIAAFLARQRVWRWVAAGLALAMAGGDALENHAILGLLELRTTDAPGAAELVASVGLWTTVKWSALFASMLLTAALLWARGGGVTRALAMLPLATGVAGIVALCSSAHRPLIEVAGVYGVGMTWMVVMGMAMLSLRGGTARR